MGFSGGPVVRNWPWKVGNTSLIPDPGRSHTPQSNKAHVPQPLSLCPGAWESQLLSLCAVTPEPVCRDSWTGEKRLLSPCATTPEPVCNDSWARVQWLLSPSSTVEKAAAVRSVHHNQSNPTHCNWRARAQQWRPPAQPKVNKYINLPMLVGM